jgi:hypothetical protein
MAGILFYNADSAIGGVDEYTRLMLHMDGVDNGTVFTDDSASNHSVYRYNAVTKTAIKKLGTASGYFDGTGDYLDITGVGDFNFGSDDFTIDFWVNTTHTLNGSTIVNVFDSPSNRRSWVFTINVGGKGAFFVSYNGISTIGIYSDAGINDGAWHHCAIIRNGSELAMYIDGIKQIDVADVSTNSIYYNVNTPLTLGRRSNSSNNPYYFNGYIDELRISNGIARWTTDFTPEIGPYTE